MTEVKPLQPVAANMSPIANPSGEKTLPLDAELYAGNHQAEHLVGKIKAKWNELSDEDVTAYHSQPEHFYTRLNEKYGITREQAELDVAAMIPPPVVPVEEEV